MQNNEMLLKFINTLFPNGFSSDVMEYGIIVFNNNTGVGVAKVGDNATATSIDIEPQQIIDTIIAKGGNETLLVHSQPEADMNSYPTEDDVNLFNMIEQKLSAVDIRIYNNAIISSFQCTSFKDAGIEGNFG